MPEEKNYIGVTCDCSMCGDFIEWISDKGE